MPKTNMAFMDTQFRADVIQEASITGCDIPALEKNYPRVRKGQIHEWLAIGHYLVYRPDGTRRTPRDRKRDNLQQQALATFYEEMEKAYRRYRIEVGACVILLMRGQKDPKREIQVPSAGDKTTLHNQYRRFFGTDLGQSPTISIQQNLQMNVEL